MRDRDRALAVLAQVPAHPPTPSRMPMPFVRVTLWAQGKACRERVDELERRSGEINDGDEAGGVELPALLW